MADFLFSYFLTILIEGTVLYLLLRRRYGARLIAGSAIIASSLTIPFVWFLFPLISSQFPVVGFGSDWSALAANGPLNGSPFNWSWVLQTALAESFAVIVETGVYRILFMKISWKDAFFASLVCNAASFGIGLAAF